jgi:hypothetical protein
MMKRAGVLKLLVNVEGTSLFQGPRPYLRLVIK